jgi:hypothetical protein
MNYWTYTPSNHIDFNDKLRALIDSTPTGKQSQKQPVSHYDGYNHSKSININYPEFQHSRHYLTWVDPEATVGYEDNPPPEIDYSYDQLYKVSFWERIAPLIKQFARDVAVRPETKLNYQINVDMMWFHRMDKGDYDNWHNHSYCQWVGVYYVDLPEGEQTLLQDYEGNEFQPDVKEGQLLIFPASYIHKSPVASARKTVINFNFNISSKYTKETIDKVKETHPDNYFDIDKGIKPYK